MKLLIAYVSLVLALATLPIAAQAQNGLTPAQCTYVATLSAMASDLRAIDRATSEVEAARFRTSLARRLVNVSPGMLREARSAPALNPHAGDFATFLAGATRYLREGGHPGSVPSLERVALLGATLACTGAAMPLRNQASRQIRRAPFVPGLEPPPQTTPSEPVYVVGPPKRRGLFYLGTFIFALSIFVTHLRTQRLRRLTARHTCHLDAMIRIGRHSAETTVQDLSQVGARLRGVHGREGLRSWLMIDGVWHSARVEWQTRHCTGLRFDHPLNLAALGRALAPPSAQAEAPHTREPTFHTSRRPAFLPDECAPESRPS